MTRGKKRNPKGYSLFFRKDRRRWCLTRATALGWDQPETKLLPADIGRNARARAQAWVDVYLQNAEALDLTPRMRPGGIRLRDRFDSWIRLRRNDPKTSPATLRSYDDLFRNVVMRPFKDGRSTRSLGDEDIVSLGTDFSLLRQWIRAAAKEHSPSRARSAFFALRSFYDDALVEKWFRGANPLKNDALIRELPALPTAHERGGVVHADLAIAQSLLDSKRVPLRRRARYAVALTSGGLRDGEISGLTWATILDLEDAELARLDVTKARRLVRRKDEVLGEPKTKTTKRVVPVHPAAREALLEWREDETDGIVLYLGRRPLPSDPVFPSSRPRDRGAFARPDSAELIRDDLRAMELATTNARGRNLTFHALRKTFGNMLYELDTDEITRKRLIGHGMQDVTAEFYTGEAFRKMSRALATIPLRWTRGVGFEPAPRRPRAMTGPRPGSLTERILEHARRHPEARAADVARAVGGKPGTVASTMSDLRAAGLLPPPLPRAVSRGRDMSDNRNDIAEPPSRFELETYGLRNRGVAETACDHGARDVAKRASASAQGNDRSESNDLAVEASPEAGREHATKDGKSGQKTGAPRGPVKARPMTSAEAAAVLAAGMRGRR